MDWVAVAQQLDRDLLAIEMVRCALIQQEESIRSIPLFDSETGTPISKLEFKELGAAGMIINQVGAEAIIALVANAVETFSIRLERHLGVKWEAFSAPSNEIQYAERVRQFRALNNVFKHQEGYVDSECSRSARYLVKNGYFADKTYLKHYDADSIVADFEIAIYEAFSHMYGVCFQLAGLRFEEASMSGKDLVAHLKHRVIYDVIQSSLVR
ncbi:hypothetical protein E8E95_14720 [Pseudomonas sp. BN414]|uniref:hypothetical protein n=1 Tax=Pseudomonas sp. BN414 TaxID=2567888 RepID=UPI002457094C|nr:hypothetical protein [Pseudomonas sp. BN414]MDH4567934.1 hypothetical protein [Pseudomonas sp. BN414]